MADEHKHHEKGTKRKAKRSQIQMAKKFARRRDHGTDIGPEAYQYMVRVLELMNKDFPSFEEKLLFVNNVYKEVTGDEIKYARNQIGSRILESLLKYADLETIQRLVAAFTSSLRPLSTDKFASHVLQEVIMVCADRGNKCTSVESCSEENTDAAIEVKESEVQSYNDIVLQLSKYFINNMEEFVFDTYANHLLRTTVKCLGGLIDQSNCKQKDKVEDAKRRPVVCVYKDLLFQTCDRLLKWPQFLEFGQNMVASGLLQSILYSLKDLYPKTAETYIKRITNVLFIPGKDQQLSNIFNEEYSVRLLEACIAVGKPETLHNIYIQFFSGNLKHLSSMPNLNFSVQRLLDHWTTKEDFEKVFEEVTPCFSEILKNRYTGILVSLANACLRLQTKQGAFLTELLKVLHCEGNERQHRIVMCIINLKTWEELENITEKNNSSFCFSMHGSLIVQSLLNFNKPIKVVNSLLETSEDELLQICCDKKGSYIVDSFMNSKYIGEKSREKLAKKFKGCWVQLATGTHGSRCLDSVWKWAQINQRISMMEELAHAGESLLGTKCGKIIANKLNVPLFARSKADWKDTLGKEEKTKTLFASITGDTTKNEK